MPYQVIATLGPASSSPSLWSAMLVAGATGFRLNTSHFSLDQLDEWLERIAVFRQQDGRQFPLVLDLQGSKWRLGDFPAFSLQTEQEVDLIHADRTDRPHTLPVPHSDFFEAAPLSDCTIALNDARSRLQIESIEAGRLRAKTLLGGEISPRKGIILGASTYRQERLGEQDRQIFERTSGLPLIAYAISYVKDAGEMAGYRSSMGDRNDLIAKIERQPAIEDALAIARHAGVLWLARGDLGAELGLPAMAAAAHRFARQVKQLPIPALLAGQVLEHMVAYPQPTRSEVCYLYDALQQGYQGFVLSDETAIGDHPVEACRAAAMFQEATGLQEILLRKPGYG